MKELAANAMRVILLLSLVGSVANGQGRHFTADDLPKIVQISDPQISPDGKNIAFVVGRANLKEDRWDTDLELVDIATKRVRIMTHDRVGVGAPRWSPAGDRLAFLTLDANQKGQIFVLPMDGGESVQVTHSKTSVLGFVWRPDGLALAYAAADEEPEKKDEAKFEDGFEVGDNDILERSQIRPIHLWMQKIGDADGKRLTSGSWSLPNHLPRANPKFDFTPDGKSIIFARAESPLTGDAHLSRLMILTLADGKLTPLTKAATEESNPIISPDGSKVVYVGKRDNNPGNGASLFVAPTVGGTGTDVSYALDRSTGVAAWLPDSKSLLVVASDHTKIAIWQQPVGGKAVRLDLGQLNPSLGVNVGSNGGVAFTATTPDDPAELFYMAKIGDATVQMTHLQTVTNGVVLGKSETVHWKYEQFEETGVLTYPPNYLPGKKYPMVLFIHGGPASASWDSFDPSAQILAGKGWLVFEPNYRGGNSDGNAYQAAIVKDAGVGPAHDVMAGLKMLEARGIVDEKQVAVSGWSYGGYMTAWLIGNYPDVWRAAVAGAPVTDMVDIYALGDLPQLALDTFGPSPFVADNLKLYVAESPITYASKIKTPTLILSDVGDYRVPIPQAYKLYHALRDNGVPVKFIAYPVAGHSPADPIRARDVWRQWTAWLGSYLSEDEQKHVN